MCLVEQSEYMAQNYYRPEWTCGRYNEAAEVALMYNLIEGKSFFFESYSARVIAEILSVGRNGCINIADIASNTGIAEESIVDFFEQQLIDAGLVCTRIFSKDEIHNIRKQWGMLCKDNPQETQHNFISSLKTEQIIDSQTAEMEYNKHLDINTHIHSVALELTYNCSEKCIHCYNIGATCNDTEKSERGCLAEMSIEDYKHLIDELDALGCYKVCLTGGDPFSKRIAWDIIDYLYEKEIAFDIFTNGLAITTQVERLIDYYPRLVGVSIYSGIPEVHDSITRIKGSFEKSMKVVKELSEYGTPLALKCCVMKPNVKSYHLVKELAKEYGAVCQIEANLCMGVDGDMSMINHLRLSREVFEVLLRDKDTPLYVGLDLPNEGKMPKEPDFSPCGGGYGGYTITPNGDMVVCANLHYAFGNVIKMPLLDILQGEKMKVWRALSIGKIEGCGTKPECEYCNLCSGNNYNEHGVLTKPSDVNCWIANMRYEVMQRLKAGEDTLNGLTVEERIAQLPIENVEIFSKEIVKH